MPRDLSTLPRLMTAEQVLDFMRAAPEDLLLQTGSDLTPDEWNDRGSAVRNSDSIYIIVSLSRSGVDNIPAYVDLLRGRHSTYETWPEELAIVDEHVAQALIHDAEEGYADRRLSRGPFADMWLLRSHPADGMDMPFVMANAFSIYSACSKAARSQTWIPRRPLRAKEPGTEPPTPKQ